MQLQTNFSSLPYYRQPLPRYGFDCIYAEGPEVRLLGSVSTDQLYADLAHSGAVVYRGFIDTLQNFNDFVSAHSSRITVDPARKNATANTSEIQAGYHEMGLHRENGNLPLCPDIQWFFCMKAASIGSETTLCDGQKVLFDISAKTRKLFERRKIKYSRRVPWDNLKRFLSVELDVPINEITDQHLRSVNQEVEGQKYQRIDENLVHSELVVSALTQGCFDNRKSFCNSLLGPSINYEPPRITWDNGEEISFDVWDEIKEVASRHTYSHFWKQADVVVVDHTRVMHGRRQLDDVSRRIFGAQSYRIGDTPR